MIVKILYKIRECNKLKVQKIKIDTYFLNNYFSYKTTFIKTNRSCKIWFSDATNLKSFIHERFDKINLALQNKIIKIHFIFSIVLISIKI